MGMPLSSLSFAQDATLIAYYPLDGNANDAKGTHTGTATSVTFSAANGLFNLGAGYAGSPSRIQAGSAADLKFTNMSMSVWSKRAGTGGTQTLLWYDNGGASFWSAYSMYYNNGGQLVLNAQNGTAANVFTHTSTGSITDTTKWHHVVITRQSPNTNFYIDGSLDSNVNGAGAFIYLAASIGLQVGADTRDNWYQNGALDDMGIFNRVLTANEVNGIYSAGPPLLPDII